MQKKLVNKIFQMKFNRSIEKYVSPYQQQENNLTLEKKRSWIWLKNCGKIYKLKNKINETNNVNTLFTANVRQSNC